MMLIVVAGMPGAGKEEFLSAAAALGIPFVRMGDVVRETYSASDSESRGISVGEFAAGERKIFGPDIWARRVMEKAGNASVCLIDGCRSMDEVRTFRGLADRVITVAVHASPAVRYERLVKRARSDAPSDLDAFAERDSRELGWGAGEVIALADYVIPNMSGLDEFHSRAENLLRNFI